MKLRTGSVLVSVTLFVAAWFLTRPQSLPEDALADLTGDVKNGALVWAAAGCASCHVAEDGPADLMAGGARFTTDRGVFIAPNISSDATHGVGGWSDAQLASAIMAGVGADGQHLYPAFPYTSYNKAQTQDIVDLIAYMRTLPASDAPSASHELDFPFQFRVLLGGWKALYVSNDWVLADAPSPQLDRGRYLVEALGHCAECHTPRDALGGLEKERWMGGAANPSGEGRIPNITTAALRWSEADIAAYLQSGFTPEFDSAGGSMAAVIRNTAKLTNEDRAAMAAYLKAIPAVENPEG